MIRLYLERLTDEHATVLNRIGEFAACCAFVVLMLALLFAPYALGFLPGVESDFIRGVQ